MQLKLARSKVSGDANGRDQHNHADQPDTKTLVDERQVEEIHSEEAGDQVQRQKNGGVYGEHLYDLICSVRGGGNIHIDDSQREIAICFDQFQRQNKVIVNVAEVDV